jgi:peroxiredoxin
MSNRKFWLVFAAAVLLACGCIGGLGIVTLGASIGLAQGQPNAADAPRSPAPGIGQLAPDFTLTSLSNQTIQLSALRGQPVVINFWASWCSPCTEEMPIFQEYSENYPDLQLFAVNAGESAETVQRFISQNKYTFDVLLDPSETVNARYRVSAIPATYFLDAEGQIAAIQIGSMSATQFQNYLQQIGIPSE